MNEYNIKVNFEKGQIITNLKKLVQNDYNSTKLNFTFDKEGRVLFKLLYPDGTQYVDEIQNNELVFGPGILNQEGTYEYEIALYTEDGRLTDYAIKPFEVRSELVNTDELVEPDDRVPVLDNLINEVTAIKTSAENGEFDGQDGATPIIGDNGNWFVDGIDTGLPSRGEQGEKGESGGISLEEATAITGELENLNTENKSSLVNAINEVINNMGLPILENEQIDLLTMKAGAYLLKGKSTTITYRSNMTDTTPILNDSQEKVLIVTRLNESAYAQGCLFNTSYADGGMILTIYNYSKKSYEISELLTKTNTTSYAPTSDYNPATKKYVDDLVGDISTVLSTLTTVSEVSE